MKIFSMVILLILMASFSAAQAVIENPAKPISENAGRIVTLKEDLRIEDTGEGFFFKSIFRIRISSQGDILIMDRKQALHFDAQGRFLRNLFKEGQGPGELNSVEDIHVTGDRIYLVGNPPKILVFDYKGNLVKEIGFSIHFLGYPSDRLVKTESDRVYLISGGRPGPDAGAGFIEIPQNLFEITLDGKSNKIASFPIPGFFQGSESGITGQATWNILNYTVLPSGQLAVNSSPEYGIDIFDFNKGIVIRRFSRPYSRIKRSGPRRGVSVSGSPSLPPAPKFIPDIQALHCFEGNIWVQTSTVVEGKGILFDVFDIDGKYLDNFYMPTSAKTWEKKPANMDFTFAAGCAYFKEKSKDDLIVVKKCRLVGL
jgi:hypothetical protein